MQQDTSYTTNTDSLHKPDTTFPVFPAPVDSSVKNTVKAYRTATLGYSYYKHMMQHETRSVVAYISINNPASVIISRVEELNGNPEPVRRNDTFSVFTYNKNFLVYKYVEVSLLQNDSDFIQQALQLSDRQEVDTLNGNKWVWNITPKTTKKHASLTLRVIAEKPDGNRESFESQNIAIDIIIDKNITRNVWDWMMDNPGKTLTLVIIPLIAFFGKKLFGGDKTQKPKNDPEA